MILWSNEVTDRSQNDVNRVKAMMEKRWEDFTNAEKTEWLSGLKGAINTSDIERIINNLSLLVEVLELDVEVVGMPEIPGVAFQAQLLANVDQIRAGYCVKASTPATPTIPLNTYQKWNDVEQILADVYSILLNNFNHYCGYGLYAGGEIGLLL